MSITTISQKGAVVIPSKLRTKYHIEPGQKIQIIEQNGSLVIKILPADPIKSLRGSLKSKKSVSEILKESRQIDEAHEQFLTRQFGEIIDEQ